MGPAATNPQSRRDEVRHLLFAAPGSWAGDALVAPVWLGVNILLGLAAWRWSRALFPHDFALGVLAIAFTAVCHASQAILAEPGAMTRALSSFFPRLMLWADPTTSRIGPESAADGSYTQNRSGKTGEQIVTNAHGKYFEASHRGVLFAACEQGTGGNHYRLPRPVLFRHPVPRRRHRTTKLTWRGRCNDYMSRETEMRSRSS